MHRRKEKKRPHSRPLSRRVKAVQVAPKGALSNSHRALALTLLALAAVAGPQDGPQTGTARSKLSLRNCPFGCRPSRTRGTAVKSIAIEAVMGPWLICSCAESMTH